MIEDYINKQIPCKCGKIHEFNILGVSVSNGAVSGLRKILQKGNYNNPFFVYDINTYEAAGNAVESFTPVLNIQSGKHIFESAELIPDEKAIGELIVSIDKTCDIIIAVGSGTINDLCRFVSYKLNMPYAVVATAASMDGYASGASAIIVKNTKLTYKTQLPKAIIADLDILSTESDAMIAAGVGDILGKHTCLCDWRLSSVITGEYYCGFAADMVKESIKEIEQNISLVKSKDEAAAENIMNALITSGIAMSFAGSSRPASGSEHHLSHYWEMQFMEQGRKPILHGAKVGVATVMVLKMFESLLKSNVDFRKAIERASSFSIKDWENRMRELYGTAAPSVIELERRTNKNKAENVINRIKRDEHKWDEISEIISELPSHLEIEQMLLAIGAPTRPAHIGVDNQMFINSVIAAKELRNRFGLLQMIFDLGISKELAEDIL